MLAVGTMVLPAMEAARALAQEGIDVTVVNCRFMKPFDRKMLQEVIDGHDSILVIEEGTVVNGFGSFMAREIEELKGEQALRIDTLGVPDRFIAHGSRKSLLREIDLDAVGIAGRIRKLSAVTGAPAATRESA